MSMWGGGLPPPKPPPTAPPATPVPVNRKKSFASSRDNELAALRQKGLAKLLNKHFTTVTKEISKERAAAEEALRDLEARKARTSEFHSSINSLTFYDEKYKEVQQKRAGLKRKERETLLLYQRYVEKFGATGAVAIASPNTPKDVKPPPSPKTPRPTNPYKITTYGSKIPEMANSIEDKLNSHVSAGGDKVPSIETMGLKETYQSRVSGDQREVAESSRRELEARGVDAKASPSTRRLLHGSATNFGIPLIPTTDCSVSDSKKAEIDASDAAVSTKAEEPTPEKRKSFGSKSNVSSTPETLETTFVYEDEEDKSNVSGLTSVLSSGAMSEAEGRLVDFLKTETEAIRQMMDEEETGSQSSGLLSSREYSVSSTVVGNESTIAAQKAEDMVNQMQKMISDFHDTMKNESKAETAFEPYELETPDPNEKWFVLWDPNHQRKYFHERNSGKVQWEKPFVDASEVKWEKKTSSKPNDNDFVPLIDFSKKTKHPKNLMTYYETIEEAPTPRRSRRDLYRQKQRKRRNRRRIAFVSLVTCSAATYYCYHRHQTDFVFREKVNRTVVHPTLQLLDKAIGKENMKLVHEVATGAQKREAERLALEEEGMAKIEKDRKEKEKHENEEKERHQLAKVKAEEEARREAAEKNERQRLAKEEADRKERQRLVKEEAGRKERQRLAKEEQERIAKAEQEKAEALAKKEKERLRTVRELQEKEAEAMAIAEEEERKRLALMRPWLCNLPLSYIVSKRCRKLSTANPVFDLKDFVDSMLQ
mmetsp:Transcript_2786/g.4166  ORF Transcript_2786/g.4166 Transcript_2786/m.4166 type:complete len:766 (-) Transcript_2786:167-2464(-)